MDVQKLPKLEVCTLSSLSSCSLHPNVVAGEKRHVSFNHTITDLLAFANLIPQPADLSSVSSCMHI